MSHKERLNFDFDTRKVRCPACNYRVTVAAPPIDWRRGGMSTATSWLTEKALPVAKKITVDERALRRVVVQLIGAASAYKEYAKGDPMKKQRVKDFKSAAAIGRSFFSNAATEGRTPLNVGENDGKA